MDVSIKPKQANQLATRNPVTVIVCALAVIVVTIFWNTWSHQREFKRYDSKLVQNSLQRTATEITENILSLRKRANTFALQNKVLLRHLVEKSNDTRAFKKLVRNVKEEFPNAITAILYNNDGEPYFQEFDGLVLDECHIDIDSFASSKQYPDIYIHPNPMAYHFDILTNVDLGFEEEAIFYISFSSAEFAEILKDNQLLGHKLSLIKKENRKLVEISDKGSRQSIAEVNRYLTDQEINSVVHSTPVQQTSWILVDLPQSGYFDAVNLQPWYQAVIIIGAILFLVVYMFRTIEIRGQTINQQVATITTQSMELVKNKSMIEKERNQGIDLLERMTDAYIFVNRRWVIEKANPQTDTIFQINRFDAVGKNFWDIFPEAASSFYKNFKRAMDGQLISQFEGFYPPLNKWFALSLYPSDSGMSIFFRDITDNKVTTDELKRREEQIRAIVDTSLEGILTIDEEGIVHSFNRTAEKMFGYSAQEIIGESLVMLMPENHRLNHNDYIRNYLRTGKSRIIGKKVELQGVRKNNEVFPIELTVGEILTTEGRFFTGFVRDITQEKEALQAKMIAEHASQAKSYFLANMSHEIRTPLMTILGFADTLLSVDQDEAGQIEAVQTIISSGEHLLNLINDILDISKIEAGKLSVEKIKFSPIKLLTEVENIMSGMAKQKGLQFNIAYHFPMPEHIQSDYVRTKQILINLCSNAIKFTETGSVEVVVSHDINNNLMSFKVIDTGIGLTEESRQKIFDVYSQAESSTTRKYGGTGLGLALTRQLAGLLGGDIIVESELGQGSEFKVTINSGIADKSRLKLFNSVNELPSYQINAPGARLRRLIGKILLAEDNVHNQRLIKMILESFGAEVDVAGNGQIAVEKALNAEFDLIYMDMQMPVMDGLEAVTKLISFGYKKPIVALTANALQEDRRRCTEVGCVDFVTKPVQRVQLYDVTKNYLKTHEEQVVDPIYSTLLDEDPNFADLVDKFLVGLEETKEELLSAQHNQNWSVVQGLIHQLKGTGSSYGFPQLSDMAIKIEKHLKASNYTLTCTLLNGFYDLIDRIVQGNSRKATDRDVASG